MPSEHLLLIIDIEDIEEAVSRQVGQIKQICQGENGLSVGTIVGRERNAFMGRVQDWTMAGTESDAQFCCKLSVPIGEFANAFQAIEDKLRANVAAVLDIVDRQSCTPREAGVELALARVRKAMDMRRWNLF